MNESDVILCLRILEKCQQQCWYGGDEYNTARFHGKDYRYNEYIDKQGNLIVVDNDPDDHPRKAGFAYSPATEEQLQTTEQALGFPLPSLLRALYSQLANGGFGPGYGLIGALGGYDEAGNLVDMYQYHSRRAQLIDLENVQSSIEAQTTLELSDALWPRYMLYLCDWGDANVSCIDCMTGVVFLICMGKKRHTYVLEVQAPSLQAWLEHWLAEQSQSEPALEPEQTPPLFLNDDDLLP